MVLALRPIANAAELCPGDCNLDGRVTIAELQRSVLISLGPLPINDCLAIDLDGDTEAAVNELVAAISAALGECDSTNDRSFPCPWPDLPDDNIHAFLMAGQSNMRGIGKPEHLSEELRLGNPQILRYRDSWVRMRPSEPFFGPEIGFAHAIAAACPNSIIGVLKRPRAATGINAWLREWDESLAALTGNATTGPLYPWMLDRVAAAERSGNVQWEGFVWVHGASDKVLLELAHAYGENMALLIEAIREDLDAPDLPFLYEFRLQRPPAPPADVSGIPREVAIGDKILELEKWRAQFEIPETYAANWSRIATFDLVHLTSEGYLIGGRLMAEALLSARQAQVEDSFED